LCPAEMNVTQQHVISRAFHYSKKRFSTTSPAVALEASWK